MTTKCQCCGKPIVYPEAEVESQLYSPRRSFILCELCGDAEEKAVEEAGTNNLPDLLATYRHR